MAESTAALIALISEMEQRGCLEFMESEASGHGDKYDAVKLLTSKVREVVGDTRPERTQ